MTADGDVYVANIASANSKQLQLARGLVCAFAGCIAGVLGFGWMEGFLLLFSVSFVIGVVMLIATTMKAKTENPSVTAQSYIPSKWSFFTQGAMPCVMVCNRPRLFICIYMFLVLHLSFFFLCIFAVFCSFLGIVRELSVHLLSF